MATKETEAVKEPETVEAKAYMEELVDYYAPLLPGQKKQDIVVGVNGETIRIQRGVQVKIKRKYYEILQDAARQEFAAMQARMELQKQSAKPLANM